MVVFPTRDGGEEAEVDKEFETWKVQHGKTGSILTERNKYSQQWWLTTTVWTIQTLCLSVIWPFAGKNYGSTEEEAKRKGIWLATRTRVMEHNKRAETGSESFTMGMNHLSDKVWSLSGRGLLYKTVQLGGCLFGYWWYFSYRLSWYYACCFLSQTTAEVTGRRVGSRTYCNALHL